MEEIFGYLTESEKELAIIEAENEIRYNKLCAIWDMIDNNHDINMMEAELKVLREGGTEDDLTMLYEANEQETGQKKQGLLSTIFGAIASIFKSIGDGIKNLFSKNKVNPNEIVDVDPATLEAANQADGVFAKIKNFLVTLQSKKWVKAVELAAVVVAAVAGFIGIWNKKKPDKAVKPIKFTKGKLQGLLNKLNKKSDETTQDLGNAGKSADSADNSKKGPIKNALGKIKEFATNGIKKVVGAITTLLGIKRTIEGANELAGAASNLSAAKYNNADIEAEITNLTERKNTLKKQLAQAKQNNDVAKIDQLNQAIGKLNATIENKQKALHESEEELDRNIAIINKEYGLSLTLEEVMSDDFVIDEYISENTLTPDNTTIFGFDPDDTSVLEESEELDAELEELRSMLAEF